MVQQTNTTELYGLKRTSREIALELQGMFRTIRPCLEEQYRMRIRTHHPCLPWLFRHVSWLRDRFRIDQRDQRIAYQRHYQRPLVQFGECILGKDPHKQRFKYEAN
eukprot:4685016-Amphidinium_carterae.4